ncbi:hypothetical protein [Dyella sp. M7H15-1]|nr:hypothetical protein [Dyella sp. M7H15-1]
MDSFCRYPNDLLPAYRHLTHKHGKVWMEHDVLAYTEHLADDMTPTAL